METDPWFFSTDGATQQGPVDLVDVISMIRRGDLSQEALLWTSSFAQWKPVKSISQIRDQMRLTPPPLPKAPPRPAPLNSDKKRKPSAVLPEGQPKIIIDADSKQLCPICKKKVTPLPAKSGDQSLHCPQCGYTDQIWRLAPPPVGDAATIESRAEVKIRETLINSGVTAIKTRTKLRIGRLIGFSVLGVLIAIGLLVSGGFLAFWLEGL